MLKRAFEANIKERSNFLLDNVADAGEDDDNDQYNDADGTDEDTLVSFESVRWASFSVESAKRHRQRWYASSRRPNCSCGIRELSTRVLKGNALVDTVSLEL